MDTRNRSAVHPKILFVFTFERNEAGIPANAATDRNINLWSSRNSWLHFIIFLCCENDWPTKTRWRLLFFSCWILMSFLAVRFRRIPNCWNILAPSQGQQILQRLIFSNHFFMAQSGFGDVHVSVCCGKEHILENLSLQFPQKVQRCVRKNLLNPFKFDMLFFRRHFAKIPCSLGAAFVKIHVWLLVLPSFCSFWLTKSRFYSKIKHFSSLMPAIQTNILLFAQCCIKSLKKSWSRSGFIITFILVCS